MMPIKDNIYHGDEARETHTTYVYTLPTSRETLHRLLLQYHRRQSKSLTSRLLKATRRLIGVSKLLAKATWPRLCYRASVAIGLAPGYSATYGELEYRIGAIMAHEPGLLYADALSYVTHIDPKLWDRYRTSITG